MLLVGTYLDTSKIQGIGLFAAEFIPKGTLVWRFTPGLDFVLKKKDLDELPEIAKSWVLRYAYYNKDEGGYVVCIDDARFFNHSETPNTDNSDKADTIAKMDIQKGEELTCNYFEFAANTNSLLGKEL
ncbi:MAG: SET domain-containing protein [Candidatus Woesearchaeota archaeon]